MPAAAGVALLVSWRGGKVKAPAPAASSPAITIAPAPNKPATDSLAPVAIENVLYAARNEGLVHLTDGALARRQRLQFVDTITWKAPQSNVSMTWTLPREEVRVVRIIYH